MGVGGGSVVGVNSGNGALVGVVVVAMSIVGIRVSNSVLDPRQALSINGSSASKDRLILIYQITN